MKIITADWNKQNAQLPIQITQSTSIFLSQNSLLTLFKENTGFQRCTYVVNKQRSLSNISAESNSIATHAILPISLNINTAFDHELLVSFLKITNIIKLSSGTSFMVFLLENNRIEYTFCLSELLMLQKTKIPENLAPQFDVIKLSAGHNHCVILTKNHDVFSFGSGTYGQLGIGNKIDFTDEIQRVVLPENDHGVDIAAGTVHSLVIGSISGSIYSFGCGAYYRLGHGDLQDCLVPTKIKCLNQFSNCLNLQSLMNQSELEVVFNAACDSSLDTGNSSNKPRFRLCACNTWHNIVVSIDNEVFAWGWNKFGQCGQLSSESRMKKVEMITIPQQVTEVDLINDGDEMITKISCGSRHSAILTINQRLFVMGSLGCDISSCDGSNQPFDEAKLSGFREITYDATSQSIVMDYQSHFKSTSLSDVETSNQIRSHRDDRKLRCIDMSSSLWGLAMLIEDGPTNYVHTSEGS